MHKYSTRPPKLLHRMFGSWKRPSSRTSDDQSVPNKERSIPIPLKDYNKDPNFTNSSRPAHSEVAKPEGEFSKVKSMISVHSLRRFVRPPSDTQENGEIKGERMHTQKVKEAEEPVPPKPTSGSVFSSTSSPNSVQAASDSTPSSSWWPKSGKADDKSGNAWAFWARGSSSSGAESGKLAVSGTETEHDPRRAEIEMLESVKTRRSKPAKPSIVLPEFSSIDWPSKRSRLANLLWAAKPQTQLLQKSPQKPKRAVVIGVHGYFPARMTRAILGEPTGTSIKFASEAESRLQHWFRGNFPNDELKIDKIALEGEGKIEHRVDRLYGLLLNWESLLKSADFVFFAVHSQGAVVTVNIVARLLQQQLLNSATQNITIMSMAGSLLGPMPGMDQTLVMKAITRIEHDSLIELFQLQNLGTSLSMSLQTSLSAVLQQGVKLVAVGSADDQLIPLYSALACHVQHPNIYRAVYIDGDDVIPDVVAPLLQLATQQLNTGKSDHGVIAELSSVLAGALTSKGHSKLYSSDRVYDLGLKIALQTVGTQNTSPNFDLSFRIPKPTANPYVLPWAANALVSDSRQSKRLLPVVNELLQQFNDWKPQTKQMKDLKLRLGGISRISKL